MAFNDAGNLFQETELDKSSYVSKLSSQSCNHTKHNRRVRVLSPHSNEPENSRVGEDIFNSENENDSPAPILSASQFFSTQHPAHMLIGPFGSFPESSRLPTASNLHIATSPNPEPSHFQRVQVQSGMDHMYETSADFPGAARELFEALRLREKYMLQMCHHMHKTASRFLIKYRQLLGLPRPEAQDHQYLHSTPRPLESSRRKKSLLELPINPPPHFSHPYEPTAFDPKSLPPALEDGTLFCRMEQGVFAVFHRVYKPLSCDTGACTQSDLIGSSGSSDSDRLPNADAEAHMTQTSRPDALQTLSAAAQSNDIGVACAPIGAPPESSALSRKCVATASATESASGSEAEAGADAEWLEERVSASRTLSGGGVSAQEFLADAARVTRMVSDGALKTFAFRRLSFLQSRFQLHLLLNEALEATEQKRVSHRDFYNIRKVQVYPLSNSLH